MLRNIEKTLEFRKIFEKSEVTRGIAVVQQIFP